MKQPITMIVACRNDEDRVADCLASIDAFADEVLIADLGCTDRSLEIAAQHEQVRIVPFANARPDDFLNWTASQADSPWVMLIDADERLTPALIDEIELELSRGARFDTYQLRRSTLVNGKTLNHGQFKRDQVGRLFRQGTACFEKTGSRFFLRAETETQGFLKSPLLRQPNWQFDFALQNTMQAAQQDAADAFERGKTTSAFRLLTRPAITLTRDLLFRGGIRDGEPGIRAAWLSAIQTFSQHAELRSRTEQANASFNPPAEANHQHQRRVA